MQNHTTRQPGHFTPTVFSRYNKPLHAVWLESQAWFCARDFGRLIGRYLDEHALRKLDADQTRTVSLLQYGVHQETLMVSESGIYTVLVHHYLPENRNLRHWLTHEVITVLRDSQHPTDETVPNLTTWTWPGLALNVLHWHDDQWVRMKDLPSILDSSPRKSPVQTSWRNWRSILSRPFRAVD